MDPHARFERRGKGIGLRLGVRTSGCSGLAYKLEFVDEKKPEDVAFEAHGVTVVVDPKSLPYLDGTVLDFTREGLNVPFFELNYGSWRIWGATAGMLWNLCQKMTAHEKNQA